MRKKLSLLIATLVISILIVQPIYKPVSGHGGDFFNAWARNTPTIDGYIKPATSLTFIYRNIGSLSSIEEPAAISGLVEPAAVGPPRGLIDIPAEWEDADTVSFTMDCDEESHDATLYVMNDYVNLYVALKIEDDDYYHSDGVLFAFDDNHNGAIDTGENWLSLSDMYIDYFNDESGLREVDTNEGGFNDGIGASQFRAIDGDYHFEIAFPLNTADDDHDFSLSITDRVGFAFRFFDHQPDYPYFSEGWWPSPDPDEWADIDIAVPPHEPPPSLVDLRIEGIEVTQAIQYLDNRLPLIREKTTVARVYVTCGPLFGTDVTVYLFGIENRHTLGVLKQRFTAPRIPNRGTTRHTANFLLPRRWTDPSLNFDLNLKAFVKAYSAAQSEMNYDNNWMIVDGSPEPSFSFWGTYVPTIYTARIDGQLGAGEHYLSWTNVYAMEEFFETIYPVQHVNYVRLGDFQSPDEDGDELIPGHELNVWLEERFADCYDLEDGSIDQIFGYTINDAVGFAGLSDVAANGGGYAEGYECVMAHEINHHWGPIPGWGNHVPGCGAPGPDPWWPYEDATIQEFGFNTQAMTVVDDDTAEVESYCGTPKWISPYRWNRVEDFLELPPLAASDNAATIQPSTTECLRISGWINRNGTGSLNPIFRLSDANESVSIPGNYSLILKDSAGSTLLTHSFQAQFLNPDGMLDSYYFRKRLPLITGTAQVLLTFENTTILDTITMSNNAPTVRVLSPNGGEVWNPDIQTIVWEAEDLDGDPLAYRLYYIPSTGASWIPISATIEGTSSIMSCQIDASFIPGSNTALILVVASDGFNVGQDMSDAVFSVVDKSPTVKIIRPQMESQFHMDDVILLRGKAHDADDVILPETAYNWTSSVDGYLGNGTTLTTLLTPGTHNITLTVTDSKGNKAEDTVEITVNLDIIITEITPYKTVVGQNSSTHINVTVENRGPITQTFNLIAQANTTVIGTQVISNLTSGNSTTITFMWNTEGFPKGDYDLTVTAILAEYEITCALDRTATVTILGDVDGDFDVDIIDVVKITGIYGSRLGDLEFSPNSDIDGDGVITILDVVICTSHYGDKWP